MASHHSFFSINPALLFFLLLLFSPEGGQASRFIQREAEIRLPSEREEPAAAEEDSEEVGTRWAVLVAGSSGYGNYRHQVITVNLLALIKFL